MGIRARAAHNWCVTRGNHPDQHPYYCPLTQLRHSAAVAEYHQLLQPAPDNATDFYTRLADMAVVIPQQDAAFWYHLTAAVTTTWMPINANTDLEAARKAALAQIAPPPPPPRPGGPPRGHPHPRRTDATRKKFAGAPPARHPGPRPPTTLLDGGGTGPAPGDPAESRRRATSRP